MLIQDVAAKEMNKKYLDSASLRLLFALILVLGRIHPCLAIEVPWWYEPELNPGYRLEALSPEVTCCISQQDSLYLEIEAQLAIRPSLVLKLPAQGCRLMQPIQHGASWQELGMVLDAPEKYVTTDRGSSPLLLVLGWDLTRDRMSDPSTAASADLKSIPVKDPQIVIATITFTSTPSPGSKQSAAKSLQLVSAVHIKDNQGFYNTWLLDLDGDSDLDLLSAQSCGGHSGGDLRILRITRDGTLIPATFPEGKTAYDSCWGFAKPCDYNHDGRWEIEFCSGYMVLGLGMWRTYSLLGYQPDQGDWDVVGNEFPAFMQLQAQYYSALTDVARKAENGDRSGLREIGGHFYAVIQGSLREIGWRNADGSTSWILWRDILYEIESQQPFGKH